MMIVNTKNWGRHGSVMFEGRVRKILVWFPNPLSAGSDFFKSDGDPIWENMAISDQLTISQFLILPLILPYLCVLQTFYENTINILIHVWKIEGCVDWLMYDFKHSHSFSLWIWYNKVVSFVSRAHACFASSAVWPICLP